MVNINGIRRVALLTLLILVIILFCLDRYAAYKHRPAGDSNAVVIYTTKRCPYCVKLRADLKANRITHKEYDVEKGWEGFWECGHSGHGVSQYRLSDQMLFMATGSMNWCRHLMS